jgi:flagellar protein FliO/FliZ
MINSIPSSRAAARAATLSLGIWALGGAPARAFTPSGPAAKGSESAPLGLGATAPGAHASTGGPSITRTIVGLLVVVGVIWGVSRLLGRLKSGREGGASGSGLRNLATLPLGSGRSLHLVRAGSDYLLLGSAEQGVVPIQRYTREEAQAAGLLTPAEPEDPGRAGASGPVQMPGAARMPGAAQGLLDRAREWTVRR